LKQVTFLCHIILKGGIYLDPCKIQDVLSWNAPTSVGDIQSFLGLFGYYQRFIKGFSKISKPMTEFIQELKKRLMTAPILVMPDMEKSFSIYCDVSGQ
jgi:hypothetical protein